MRTTRTHHNLSVFSRMKIRNFFPLSGFFSFSGTLFLDPELPRTCESLPLWRKKIPKSYKPQEKKSRFSQQPNRVTKKKHAWKLKAPRKFHDKLDKSEARVANRTWDLRPWEGFDRKKMSESHLGIVLVERLVVDVVDIKKLVD